MSKKKAPSIRCLKISERVRRALVEVIGHAEHHSIPESWKYTVRIFQVHLSPDLRLGKVMITSDENVQDICHFCNRHQGLWSKILAEKMSLRRTPKLTFYPWTSGGMIQNVETTSSAVLRDET